MRNSILQLSASMLICSLILTSVAGQQSKEQKSDSDFKDIICGHTAEDIARFKEILKKDPQSKYASILKDSIRHFAALNFNPRLESYYQAADATKLDQIIEIGEDLLSGAPDSVYVIGHLAFALRRGLQRGFYKDLDKSKAYTERALKLLESPTPPPGWYPEEFAIFRSFVLSGLEK